MTTTNHRGTIRRRRRAVGSALAAAAIILPSLGAGAAEAKPMERDHARYCAKLRSDVTFTRNAFYSAWQKYGPDDVLTIQAKSNYFRADERLARSSCQ